MSNKTILELEQAFKLAFFKLDLANTAKGMAIRSYRVALQRLNQIDRDHSITAADPKWHAAWHIWSNQKELVHEAEDNYGQLDREYYAAGLELAIAQYGRPPSIYDKDNK